MEDNIMPNRQVGQLDTIMHEIHSSLFSINSIMDELTMLDLSQRDAQEQTKEKILDVQHYTDSIRMYFNYWQILNSPIYFEYACKHPIDLWWWFNHPSAYFVSWMKKKEIGYYSKKSVDIIPKIEGFLILKTIVAILFDNAIKYSPVGGEIICRFEITDFHLVITMENDGPYLAEDEIETIFEHGNRGRYAALSGANGNGYGLAFLAEIIYSHGGELKIESWYSSKIDNIPYGKFTCQITLPRS